MLSFLLTVYFYGYDTIRDAILTALLIYRTESTTKKWKTEKTKKTDMLRSISKQSGESVESVLKKNRKATQGRINLAEKEGFKFKPGTKE